MRYLSLFSGIEAASVAWKPLGWTPVAFSEIEPFPCALLKHHYPSIPNLGDVCAITHEQIKALGNIDVVVGGFPCQDLSVAGLRKGLHNDDGTPTRSGLFFDAMRVAEWSNARWLVMENVPGLFSSNKGRDFAVVVGEMAGLQLDVPSEGWRNSGVVAGPLGLVEWRVLDAQFVRVQSHPFAVPQRRRRVFIVRRSGDWASCPPVLLEQKSMSWHSPPCRKAGEGITGGVANCLRDRSDVSHREDSDTHIPDVSNAVCARDFKGARPEADQGMPLVSFSSNRGHDDARVDGVSPTVRVGSGVGIPSGPAVSYASGVRRLTPLECERLQGFPDHYTAVKYRNKPAADGPRYKALGNSMAVNVMSWIGRRIQAVEQLKA